MKHATLRNYVIKSSYNGKGKRIYIKWNNLSDKI